MKTSAHEPPAAGGHGRGPLVPNVFRAAVTHQGVGGSDGPRLTRPGDLPVRLAVPEVVGDPDVVAVLPYADADVLVAAVHEVVVVRAAGPFALHLAIDPDDGSLDPDLVVAQVFA